MPATEQADLTGSLSNGATHAQDLFALTDEQILEIEPEAQDVEVSSTSGPVDHSGQTELKDGASSTQSSAATQASATQQNSAQPGMTVPLEPPRWLADMMADPQAGGEARDFWQGIQQARQESAAYREVFSKPEEAKAASERARVLDEFDHAYFGMTGNSAEQTSAARAQLAETMLRENPAAFREMVFAGLRALEAMGTSSEAANKNAIAATGTTNIAQNLAATNHSTQAVSQGNEARVTAYSAFEKAANDELARSVGGSISRALEQALPNASVGGGSADERARIAVPLKERLSAAIQQDVEKSLQGDQQLSGQIAQILSGSRLDDTTRAHVVRLIDERAQQLVPQATRRVLQEWTQTTLAAHRAKGSHGDAPAKRADLSPAASPQTNNAQNTRSASSNGRAATFPAAKKNVDYGKLSDEQILDL